MRYLWLLSTLTLLACSSKPTHYSTIVPTKEVPDYWESTEFKLSENHDLLSLVSGTDIEPWLVKSLNNNPSIQKKVMELAESAWVNKQVKAEQLPQVNLGTDVSRFSTSNSIKNNFSLSLSTSWEADIWGRLADQHNAAKYDTASIKDELAFAKQSLISNVITAWLTWVNAQALLTNEQFRYESLQLTVDIINKRYQSGLGSIQDLDTAKTDLKEVAANVALQTQLLVNAKFNLQQLIGDFDSIENLPSSWPDVSFPYVSIPSTVLGRRPDLLSAFHKIKAADARSDVAYKNLLPKFNLSLDLTRASQSSGDLFSADPVWSLLGNITQPIFNGGKLKSEIKAAELRAGQAYWDYREKLIAAFFEVNKGLNQEVYLEEQYTALDEALNHARASEHYIESRYKRGLENIQSLLIAKRTTFSIHSRLLQVSLSRARNRIELGLALGLPIKHGV